MPMEFVCTTHARKRIYQRSLPVPSAELDLRIVKNKIKKTVKLNCKKSGYNPDFIYWRTNGDFPVIYVCKLIEKAKYKVITAFRLNKSKP